MNEVDFIVSGNAAALKKAASTIDFNQRYGVIGRIVYDLLSELEATITFGYCDINDIVNIKHDSNKYYCDWTCNKFRKM